VDVVIDGIHGVFLYQFFDISIEYSKIEYIINMTDNMM